MKVKAIVYLRVSTGEQAASGLGLEAQEAACRAYADAQGWEVAAVHRDEGVSGSTPVDKRDGLLMALGELKRGWVLLAAKRDRFARDVAVAAILESLARKSGASVVTPDAPATDEPFAAAMRGMMDVFAQLERALIASRTRAALAVKRARDEYCGGEPPLGRAVAETPGARKLVPGDSDEVRALELIAALRADGMPLRDIAAALNDAELKPRGARWHLTTVARAVKKLDVGEVRRVG